MADAYKVEPDLGFIRGVVENGGGDLKKCYQCATCSVVCELSPDQRPFPRKEMLWAQWGLKDKLAADPDVWLCYHCNDCTTHCPRNARPGDVLAAIRQRLVEDHAVPGFLAKWANDVRMLPVMLAIPAVLLGLALAARKPVSNVLGFLDSDPPQPGHWEYAELFPHSLLISFFTGFSVLAFLAVLGGVLRFWKAMKVADEKTGNEPPQVSLGQAIVKVVKLVLTHSQFKQCSEQKDRYVSHLGVFYGFVGLLLVTLWAILALYVLMPLLPASGLIDYPFVWWNPVKIFANVSAVALAFGCVRMMLKRVGPGTSGGGSQFDWLFVWMLLAVVGTGFLVQVLRFAGMKELGFATYFVHLVLVFDLLIYLPYSKFAHLVYRTVALVYAELSGRSLPASKATDALAGMEQVQASPAD